MALRKCINADVVILENLFSLELPIHATVGSRSAEFGIRNEFVQL